MTHARNYIDVVKQQTQYQLDNMQLLYLFTEDTFETYYKKHQEDINNALRIAGLITDDFILNANPIFIED